MTGNAYGTIPSWARVGQKVVCVDGCEYGGTWQGLAPTVGGIYVLVALAPLSPTGRAQARFTDLAGTPLHSGGRVWLERFRPLITKSLEQDIAQFLPLLKPHRAKERA